MDRSYIFAVLRWIRPGTLSALTRSYMTRKSKGAGRLNLNAREQIAEGGNQILDGFMA